VQERLGDVHLNLGNLELSRESFEESLTIRERLAEQNPENLVWQLDLVISLYKVAVMSAGDRRSEVIEEGLALVERLNEQGSLTLVQASWAELFRGLRENAPEAEGAATP
jgi:hypothetical protein